VCYDMCSCIWSAFLALDSVTEELANRDKDRAVQHLFTSMSDVKESD